MIVEVAAYSIGVVTAAAIVIPSIIYSAVFIHYCNRRLLRAELAAREWQEAATHAIISSNLQQQPQSHIIDDIEPEDDEEFPRH